MSSAATGEKTESKRAERGIEITDFDRIGEAVRKGVEWWYANFDYDVCDQDEMGAEADLFPEESVVQVFFTVRIGEQTNVSTVCFPLDSPSEVVFEETVVDVMTSEASIQIQEPASKDTVRLMLRRAGLINSRR